MERWTSFLLKAIIFVLIMAVLATGAAIVRYTIFDNKLSAPRTEAEKSLQLAVQAVKTNPNDARARIKLAAAYLEVGRVNAALSEAKIAAKLDPDDAEAFLVFGLANKEKGNFDEAVKNLEKAAKMDGKLGYFYQSCWLELAKIHMDQKKYKAAVRAYDAALGYGPESASILYDIAKAYELSGDTTSAAAYYKEVLEFVPDYEDALKSLERLKKEMAAKDKSKKPAAKDGAK